MQHRAHRDGHDLGHDDAGTSPSRDGAQAPWPCGSHGIHGIDDHAPHPDAHLHSDERAVTSWAINATLPTGLTFETSNGTIWGTPSQIIADTMFTVWANNSAGSSLTTVNITINDVQVAGIAYSGDLDLTYHHTMTTATPSTTGGTPTSWAIHPSLPSGLSFDPITGAISGTPDVLQTTTSTHTVWANNSGGSTRSAQHHHQRSCACTSRTSTAISCSPSIGA